MDGYRLYKILVHVCAWAAFFWLTASLSPHPPFAGSDWFPPYPPFLNGLFPGLIAYYYTNSEWGIPSLLAREKTKHYFGFLAGASLLLLGIPVADYFVFPQNHPPIEGYFVLKVHITMTLLLGLLVFTASTWQNILRHWFSAESQKRDIQLQKTEAELSFLKSQINPHFLFNTLNNVYTLSLMKSEKASDSILKLADMMRYVLTKGGDRPVPLENELRYIEQFIDLQRIRLTSAVEVQFERFGEAEGHFVSPLLFLPFIENAFKYGISTRTPCRIAIRFILEPGKLTFQTENQVFAENIKPEQSTGTGLPNVKRRLELLYSGKHWLRCEQTGDRYYVDLTLHENHDSKPDS